MVNSVSFIICSLIYSLILMFVYFKKNRKENKINKVYSALIISNFIGLILEISNYYVAPYNNSMPILVLIVSKLYLLYLLTWVLLLTFYTFVISYNREDKSLKEYDKKYKFVKNVFIIFYALYCILVILLPIKLSTTVGKIYSYGPSVQSIFIVSELANLFGWLFMFKNIKHIKDKKYAPLFIFYVLAMIIMLIQSAHPEMLLATSMETVVTFLIYFTLDFNSESKKETKTIEKEGK